MPTLSCKARLKFDSETDKQKIILLLEGAKFCWNEISKIKFGIPGNSISKLHDKSYYAIRERFPYLPSNLIIAVERSVLGAYRSTKGRGRSCQSPLIKVRADLQLNKRLYDMRGNKITISTLACGSRVKCQIDFHRYLVGMMQKHPMQDPSLIFDGKDVWIQLFFHVDDKKEPESLETSENEACGIDLGCNRFAATSNGTLYKDKKYVATKRRIRYLKRTLKAKADKGSKTAKKHLKKIGKRESNLSRNLAHHLSKKIISDIPNSYIVIEDLKKMQQRKNKFVKSPRISQVPFSLIIKYILYKAALSGKTVIKVHPAYTSRENHETGLCDGDRRGCRYYTRDGKIFDADINAAINIAKRSQLPISQANNLTYGQAKVNSPIVSVADKS